MCGRNSATSKSQLLRILRSGLGGWAGTPGMSLNGASAGDYCKGFHHWFPWPLHVFPACVRQGRATRIRAQSEFFPSELHWPILKRRTWAEGCSFGFDFWWWLATTFNLEIRWNLQMMPWYLRGIPMKSRCCWANWFSTWVMQAWNWMRKNRVDHNTSRATTVFNYCDRSRYQGEGKGIESQMVSLHVVCSRFQKMHKNAIFDIDYHFFSRSFLDRRSLWLLDCFTGQSPGIWTKRAAISIPVARHSKRDGQVQARAP